MSGADMKLAVLLAIALAAGLLAWFAAHAGAAALLRYRSDFTERTRFQAQEFFLFVDPRHLFAVNIAVMLLVNSLRMRPDRIIMGECRGSEAVDMLQAMNTGHDGSLTTVHANAPRDALSRLETMIQMTGMKLSEKAMRQQVASAINLVIQAARLSDGTRRITSISEITGMEGDTITMQEVFTFQRSGIDKDGKVIGRFRPTGVRPRFAERLKLYGMQLPRAFFEEV